MRQGRTLRAYTVAYLVFLYAPVLLLPIFAFDTGTIIAFPLEGFTTANFQQLWDNAALQGSVWTSLRIAVITAVISTVLGICAARASARYNFPAKGPIMGLIMVPLVLPEIIVAVALIVVIIQLGMELTSWTVILGHTLICTPFSIAILTSAFHNFDRSLEDASMDLGETRWGTFRRVTLPLVFPGVLSSLLISFTISLDEFIIAFFLTGTEPTLPVYIWSQFRFPAKLPSVMALGTILLGVSLVLLMAAEYFRRRAQARTGQKHATGGML